MTASKHYEAKLEIPRLHQFSSNVKLKESRNLFSTQIADNQTLVFVPLRKSIPFFFLRSARSHLREAYKK